MAEGPSPLPRLAALDWPPPPSPAAPADAFGRSATRLAEARARAELWAVRAEIGRQMTRSVVAFPFLGRAMRFQDEFAALQLSEDGRFSYSAVAESADCPAEQNPSDGSRESAAGRVVVTYEGVLVAPMGSTCTGGGGHGSGHDDESAAIEGQACVRYEAEANASGARLTAVERGGFRFAISVGPFFRPSMATVSALFRPDVCRPDVARSKQLCYIGPGRGGSAAAGRRLAERESTSRYRRSQGLLLKQRQMPGTDAKTKSPPSSLKLSPLNTESYSLQKVASAPQLSAALFDGAPGSKAGTDWNIYRQRAELAFRHKGTS